MRQKRGFSLYDVETFLRDAGAERVNETAVLNLEAELEDTVNDLINEAEIYANYAGRSKLIKKSDIALIKSSGRNRKPMAYARIRKRVSARRHVALRARRMRMLQDAVTAQMEKTRELREA